jgi:hypothetical protein
MTLRCSSRRKETPIFGSNRLEREKVTEVSGRCQPRTVGRFSLSSRGGEGRGEEAPVAFPPPKIAVSLRRLLQIT